MKTFLKPLDSQSWSHYGDIDPYWIGAEECESKGPGELEIIVARALGKLAYFGCVCDAEACYSYDDFALVAIDDRFFLLNTAGCSCPSPTETWGVLHGPCTLDEMETYLRDEERVNGYGVTSRQHAEFLQLIENARTA